MTGQPRSLRVSVVAFPDAVVSTLTGIYDVLSAFDLLAGSDMAIATDPPFRVEIVGEEAGPVTLASGVPLTVQRAVRSVEATDLVIVPSVLVGSGGWMSGRYS